MKVLSLFDGISCGRVALNRLGIPVDGYYAAEIDKNAIKVSKSNWPDIIQLGDVRKVDASILPKIDLILAGSPCQDFSRANSGGKGLKGNKSSLFWEFYRLLKETKATYFLLENVTGMNDEDLQTISECLGVSPIRINSSTVSAQMRDRYYWTNIPGKDVDLFGNKTIGLPEDRKIFLKDILDDGYALSDKARCLLVSDSRPLKTHEKMLHRFFNSGFTTLVFKNKELALRVKEATILGYTEVTEGQGIDLSFPKSKTRRGRAMKDKIHTITRTKNEYFIFENGDLRYLTQKELERCQTLPEGYTKIVSRNQAAACIGNGWTVDVIAHILGHLKQ